MDASNRRVRETKEAAHWWIRLGTKPPADVSEAERREFTEWLRESPLHVAELLHMAHAQDALERFKLWQEIPLDTQRDDAAVADLPLPRAADWKRAPAVSGWRTALRLPALFAAGAIVLTILVGWWMLHLSVPTLETGRAERREVVLADGSVVRLEPETRLRIEFDQRERDVELTQGRALFQVAKNPARPFIVHAGDTRVRAVGTIFGVDRTSGHIVVTVSEGKVAVSPSGPPEAGISDAGRSHSTPPEKRSARPLANETNLGGTKSGEAASTTARDPSGSAVGSNALTNDAAGIVFLVADQQLTIQPSGATDRIEKVDAARALAWSQGQLVFDSTPLSEVAAQFNQYNRVQLTIRGDALRRRTISGVFRASEPQTLIDFINAGAHVVITHHGGEEIVVAPEQ